MTTGKAVDYLNEQAKKGVIPQGEYTIVSGKVGSWRMLPNGSTCFYCPAFLLPDGTIINRTDDESRHDKEMRC